MNNLSISDRPFLISSHLSDQSHHAPRLRRECKPGLSANGHSIQDLFEAQVARTPDAIAISFQDQSLTYGELNARANKLAHRLRALGVGADCLVGICVERSIEMVVGLLGILKAGGAYVPLDPQYPTERLSFMISDTNLSVLLTQQHLRERLPDHHAQLICLDNPAECGDEFSEQNPPQTTSADHLAYVIYTSGSTGRPKGVCIDHRAVVRLVRNTNYLEFAKTDVFLQFAPVSFDASTLELWAPLLNGGRLAICPPGQLSLSELGQVVRQHGVTTLWLSAGLFHQMVDENIEDLDGLKYLLAGGDVLSPKHVKKALERLPLKQLINGYGPTENTTFTCCYGMESVSAVGESTVPIGRPISRTQVYVLNEQLEAVEVGEEGELYTGGAGLARCYLNRPELTAEKFVPNPFSRELGERLYRTGDLVRYLPTGEIEFLGRIDSQVKLRGYRIELGEIEAALNDHEAVRETAVIVREDVAGDKRLVAYVVAQQPAPARRELRTFLKAKLPDYMIPAAFMLLGELPLTANGKVDRRALPAPDQQRPELSTGFVAPRDAVEEVVATIIGQVLGVSRVGREDNFFELGGHSLLATQVITRLRIAFQVELPLRQLFEDSTVASLAVSIKRATRAGGELQAPPLGAVRRDAKLPLSFAQQRLWFIDQLNPGKSHYNLTFPIQLRGELDQRALADSLGEIIHRHESLRTVFPSVDGQPTQKILPAPERMELPSIDLRRESDCKRHQQAEILIQSEARYAFDLANGPLVRTLLVRVAEQEHLLVLTMHHIVTDGWSMGVVMEELAVLYENFSQVNSRERLSPLPELPLQYADFAVWQREWLQGAALEAQLSYWKEQLQGAPALLDFPTDHPRPPVQTFAGARRKLSLGPRTTAALTGVAHKHDATLFMTLLAAFAVLLSRYGRQSDLVVGAPIANRTQPEIEGLVGFFVNTLALRVDLSGNPSFAELLGRVRETALGAYDHQDVPFEKLVEVLQPERALSHTPLFQAMFVLQETVEPKRVQQLEIELLPAPEGVAMFDLVLEAKAIGEGIELSIEYNSDLFEGETAERMLRNFESLVEAIVEDCGQRLSELPVMSGAEREQVLVKWNQTACPFEVEKTVAELFEEQARFGPERMAVEYDRDQISYGELNRRANKLAHALQKMGVGPDVLVGVCLERSIDMIVGLLGIMKAGGAYLPLDPAYPKERLAYMVDDAGVAALLTQQSLIATLPTGPLLRTICLDTESHLDTEEREDNPERQTKAGHLAYVIYTSGSTGKPKGVQIQNSGLMNLISWFQATNELTSNDRISHLAGVAFDANMIELWPTLTVGAHLYIPTEEVRSSPTKLKDWLAERAITISFLPTPVAEQALRAPWPETTALRALQTGGDKLHRVTGANLPFKLTNLYGPTETTVVATWAPVFTGADQEIDPPIGRPLANTQIYLWDESLQPVPIGVPGEVHIGGAGVARGYLNRAQLTAEKFIPDPYSDIPGGRLYRTGDLARYLSDGSIEYLGRLDNQVKLRGFRIELGEIEAALNGHDAVREAVVIDREDVPGEKRLVAYLVVHQPAPATDQLRAFLKASLPEYMVPAVFVFLDELPLTVNGKLDRRALPAPAHGGHGLTTHYTAPRDAIEVAVARIFAEALGIDRIGIEDDFFELGGHSLLATQVVSRLLDIFGLEIRLRALFETPTIAGIAQAVAKHERLPEWISKNGAKLLNIDNEKPPSTEADDSSRLKATESGRAWQPTARIPRRGSEDPELSFAQQRLWLLDQLQPGTSLYNVPLPIRMKGSLDQRALAESLSEIIRRHESLRTVFPAVAGQPAQVILPPPPSSGAELSIIDLLAADELSDDFRSATAIGEERLQRLIEQESQRPFDLATGPLVRTLLVRVAEDEHLLLLTMHHIVTDGWSLRVLMGELGELYKTFSKDHHESPLAELPIQYTDYAIWQRQWLQGGALQEQMLYWQEQLQGAPALLELPTDHPRPPVQSFRGGFHTFTLPARLARQLRALGQQEGASLFMTLLAAFKVLLWRYSGQEQIVVGMPIANRKRVEVESLIGFFVNTLALSSKVSGELGFRELLRQVKETALGAYAHQDAPFEKLVEVLQPDRSLSYHPIFQVFFTFDTGSSSTLELPDLTLLPLDVGNGASKFDLALSLKETNGALRGSLEYSKDLFEQATIERMVRHLEILLESIVSEPERQLSTLGMLSGSEINQVLVDWNSTQSSYPDELCVHELFETQVVETPDAVAVIFQDQALTYAELNTRANQLAHRLQELGVGPDSLVGICVKPSLKMVVGVLGILKAGGAYVPLDAGYPVERLGFMMEDAGMSVLITESDLLTGLPVHRGQTLCLDTEWDLVSKESSANPESAVRGENLAYVIYTSGSTGRPKGVMIQHRGVVNYLSWAIQTYSPTAGHGAPLHSSLSFDLSVTSMFIPLLTGRCLRLLSHDHNVEALSSALKTTPDYTLVKLTPAHLQLLDEQMSAAEKKGASRALVVGGENLTWEMIRRWRDGAPETRIYNEYGPTETVVGSSIYEVGEEEAPRSGSVPIGRPIANTQLYILSKELEPVAAGVSGELYIGGAGLARGYLGRPELTAERFVPHPFSVSGGERMYRTGDLARYGADGRIEYLGRIDHQVKLRGYRIELGEIEAALSSHGSVREAAVILREDMPGDKRLVAYLVTDHLGPSVVELREYLKERLPEYMVPAAFVPLEELPLTPNGKLDRAALPAPESKGGEVDARQAARTPIEEVVAGIWSQVLGRERVRAEENFFELGGHSLLATQVMSRLRQSLQIDLPLRTLFECPTVRALAASIETTMRAADRSTQAPPIRSVSRDQLLPLSFSQQRLWFIDQLEPNQSHFNSPVAMRLNGSLSVKALADALAEIIRRHEILRTTFTSVGGQPCQIIAPATGVNLPVIDLDLLAPDKREVEAQRWVDEEAQRPFDLGCGPLLRMTLLRMAEHDHILILTKHHIITDGWSINVFVDELAQLYIAFANGEPSPLPELAIQYADHAIWQREWLQGEVLEQQLSYWRRHLAGAPAVLNLPLDRPRPAVQSLRGATHQRTISPELTRALRQLSQQEGCTLFMTLLALLKTLLFYYSAQEQIVVGTDVANRNQMESERLCGLFINHLVLNTEMSGDPTFSELLARVREVALGAYAHQDVPFEKVVEALKPERASSHSPLFQVLCVVQNTPGREFELPGLTVRPVEFQWATAKYDLGLFAEESPEGLVLGWNYKTDLFNSHTIDRIALGFEALLQAVTANREQHLSGLLALLADLHEQQRTTEEQGFVAQSALKFKTIRRKAVSRN